MANKQDLVDIVAAETGATKKDTQAIIDAALKGIEGYLSENERVQLIGFGTFEVRSRSARKGRNPRTGEVIEIAASKIPGFKAGKALKEAVKK